ncbi:MAG: hypothetical protein JZU63_09120, partial [Rhodoferax sp.]|nr:hypothetical protein [Rhodoferax sp.]
KSFVLAVPVVLSLLMLAVADHARTFQPLADSGCLLIIVVFSAIMLFEQGWRMVPYSVGFAVTLSAWRTIQPSVFAMYHASIWINIMVYSRVYLLSADGNINCFIGAARDLGKTVY